MHELTARLGGSISNIEGDRIMQFYNNRGHGRAMSFLLEKGLSFFDFDFELQEEFILKLPNDTPSIYFIYCIEGSLAYYWEDKTEAAETIQELQTVILGSKNNTLHLKLPENHTTGFTVIRVSKTHDTDGSESSPIRINERIFSHFMADDIADTFHYHGTLNLKIREQLLTVRSLRQRGIIRKLMVSGIVNFTLGLEIMHHENDMSQRAVLATSLTNRELSIIKEAVDQIATKPEFDYSIDYLCNTYLVSSRKLQEGFKLLTGKTVASYVSDERLNLAEKLLKKGNMNISEVVYSIGFSSRSYFSKIFRQKYKCTPKHYLKENVVFKSSQTS